MAGTRCAVVSTLSREEIWAEVSRHRGLCGTIAREFWNHGLDHDDLVQEGVFGLYRAVELFDRSRGIEFTTYAGYWIRHKMRTAVREQGRLVRTPYYADKLAANFRKGRLDPQTLKPRLRLCVLAAAAVVGSVLDLDNDPDGPNCGELVEDRSGTIDQELIDDALLALDRLDRRARLIITQRFGLDGEQPKTLLQVGNALGMTKERVRQIERQALAKLREIIAA